MNSFRLLVGAVALLALSLFTSPAFSQVSISLDIAPPPLVVEDQPPCPEDGLLWTPGYWAYDDDQSEYYWVPGVWVQPPQVGFLWTPAYWGWQGNAYGFYPGYWGPTVGFYGGVNYGHGYWGRGYGGGRWDNGHFAYNTAANNVPQGRFHNTYVDRSVVRNTENRVSYNGGHGGIQAQPTAQQRQFAQQSHVQATPQQQQHIQTAATQRTHEVKVNKHATAAGAQPGVNPLGAPGQNAAAGAQPAVNRHAAALTGGDAQAKQNKHSAEKQNAAANNAPAAAQSQVSRHDAATGGDTQVPKKQHQSAQNTAPVQHQPAATASAQNQAQVQHQTHVAPQQSPVNPQVRAPEQPHASATEHHAAQVHVNQPAPAQAQHAPAAQVHAPAQAAGPQGKPQAPGGGPAKQDGQPGNGH